MSESIYSRAVSAARERAAELGHALGGAWVRGTTAELSCGVSGCTAGVRVLFHYPPVASGSALEAPCVRGVRAQRQAPTPAASADSCAVDATRYMLPRVATPAGVRG